MKFKVRITSALLVGLLLTACSSGDLPGEVGPPDDTRIEPIGLVAEMEPSTRGAGPINGTGTALGISLFRADETYTAAYLAASPIAGTIATTGRINTGLYYQNNPVKKTKLIGIYPAVGGTAVTWDATTRKVAYTTMDGSTDILCSALAEGSRNTPMSTMTFSHLLTMIKVNIKCTAAAAGKWGTVNSVSLVGKKQNCEVTLPAPNATGVATVAATGTTSNLAVTTGAGVAPAKVAPTTTSKLFGQAIFLPVTTAAAIQLSIVTADGTFTKSTVSQKYEAGKAYEVTLIFDVDEIVVSTATIVAWGSGGNQDINL